MNLQDFGERLRVERVRLGATQDEMAVKLNVSKRSYCAYEAGETAPSAKLIAALAEVDGVALDYLLTGKTLKERAAEAAAEMPLRLRALREAHGIEAVVKVGGVTAKQWREFEAAQAPSGYPQGLIQRLVEGFKLDPTAFILGQHRSVTTSAPEEVVLIENYRACSHPDQEAIRHHAAFLAARKAARPSAALRLEDEAHRTRSSNEQDATIARAIAESPGPVVGVSAKVNRDKQASKAKKGESLSSGRSKG